MARSVSERLLRRRDSASASIYAGLFGLSALALAVFLWWSTAGLLERQTDAAINADSQGLAERYARQRHRRSIDTIDQRLARQRRRRCDLSADRPAFHRLAGNLEHWPQRVTMDDEWSQAADHPCRHPRSGTRAPVRACPAVFTCSSAATSRCARRCGALLTDALLWAAGDRRHAGVVGAWAVRSLFRTHHRRRLRHRRRDQPPAT